MRRERVGYKTKSRFLNTVRGVIKDVGKDVLVYKESIHKECTNCYFDSVNNKSTNKCKWTITEAKSKQEENIKLGNTDLLYKYFLKGRCPVCTGTGYLEIKRKVWINCMVAWNTGDYVRTPAGSEGSSVVTLRTDPKYTDLFKSCVYIVVDGIKCNVADVPVLKGIGNQTLLVVTAYTTGRHVVDKEVLKEYV